MPGFQTECNNMILVDLYTNAASHPVIQCIQNIFVAYTQYLPYYTEKIINLRVCMPLKTAIFYCNVIWCGHRRVTGLTLLKANCIAFSIGYEEYFPACSA